MGSGSTVQGIILAIAASMALAALRDFLKWRSQAKTGPNFTRVSIGSTPGRARLARKLDHEFICQICKDTGTSTYLGSNDENTLQALIDIHMDGFHPDVEE